MPPRSVLRCLLPLTFAVATAAGEPSVPLPRPHFPLRVNAGHRFLEDASGVPFLVVGDTAWSLVAQLREPDIARYLDDRQRRGFSAIIVNLLEHQFASQAPAKIDGVAPFLAPGDFTQPNPEYFDYAHRALAAAGERGLAVWLCPAYLGWEGKEQGFYREIKAAGSAALRAYGRYLGQRFQDLPNLVWMVGGDFALPEAERWTGRELIAGLREGGARQIATAHGGQTDAVPTFGDEPWLEIDNVYSYDKALPGNLRAAFRRTPARPFVLIETTYEGEYDAPPEMIRRQAWWAMLSGACGQFFGNNPLWHFDGPTLFEVKGKVTWQEALASTGSRDCARVGALFRRQRWSELVPDLADTLVTAGRGQGITLATAARTQDYAHAIIYFPSDGIQPRLITLDLSAFRGPMTAHWFNPAQDEAPRTPAGLLSNRAGQTITSPGNNGTGTNDWVLILER